MVIRRDAFLDLLLIVAGVYVAYAGAAELMRLTIAAPDSTDQPAIARLPRRASRGQRAGGGGDRRRRRRRSWAAAG